MKLRKIKYANHPILGDLQLDLINADTDEPYKNIFLAGENGTGKSTILNSLSAFLCGDSFDAFEFIEYASRGQILIATPPPDNYESLSGYTMTDATGTTLMMYSTGTDGDVKHADNPLYIRYDGCVFSKARADYKTKKIDATRISKLDIGKYDADNQDDFTSLKQLLVDIQSQDDSQFSANSRELSPTAYHWDEFYPTSKVFRFRNAFNGFFENISFEKISDGATGKTILFNKYGSEVDIDDLSTGEKQVVFRGSYLLKNIEILSEATILIDEPELSMHPKWERKITRYYKEIFTSDGDQSAQIFFASHSEYCLAEALSSSDTDLVIVLKTDDNGEISAKHIIAPHVLPTITSAEVNYLAFDMVSSDYHIHLYGYLQNKENCGSVKACDDFIAAHQNYDNALHYKPSQNGNTRYISLPTYIRNVIHHPDGNRTFTDEELRVSIELLIVLCR